MILHLSKYCQPVLESLGEFCLHTALLICLKYCLSLCLRKPERNLSSHDTPVSVSENLREMCPDITLAFSPSEKALAKVCFYTTTLFLSVTLSSCVKKMLKLTYLHTGTLSVSLSLFRSPILSSCLRELEGIYLHCSCI